MWNPWNVSDPWELSTHPTTEEMRADNEGYVMLSGVVGVMVTTALLLTVVTGQPF